MSYSYAEQRPWLFTEEGQLCLLKARDKAFELLRAAGAFNGLRATAAAHAPDTFKDMALLDRLVELGDVVELTGSEVWGQDRIFTRKKVD